MSFMDHKKQLNPFRDLFYEARAELAKDCDSIQFRQDEEGRDTAIICLFCRITTHLKALEVLYANDLALEADTILRSCVESVFWMGALVNQPDTVKKMENEFEYQKYSMRKRILNADPALMKLDDQTRKDMELAQQGKRMNKKDLLKLFEVAERAKLAEMYVPYSRLSNSAVHASINSLNRHLILDEERKHRTFTALVSNPDWDAVFHLACSVTLFTKHFLSDRFNTPGRDWETDIRKRFQELHVAD